MPDDTLQTVPASSSAAITGKTYPDAAKHHLRAQSQRIEFARLLLILLIVMLHYRIAPPATGDDVNIYTRLHDMAKDSVLLLAVPLLSIISGFIFYALRSFRTPRRTLAGKVRTIVVPFLIFNLPLVGLVWFLQTRGLMLDNRIMLLDAPLGSWLDAGFAITGQPVNYPLHFLRDLVVIFVVACLFGRLLVLAPIMSLIVCGAVAYFNLDGPLILRNDVFLCFVVGGVLAVRSADIGCLDRMPVALPLLALIGIAALFLYAPDHNLLWRVAGGLAVWPVLGHLFRSPLGQWTRPWTSHAFAIYLIHAVIIIALFIAGIEAQPTIGGFILWLVGPLVIAGIVIALVSVAKRIAPRLTSVALGGRFQSRPSARTTPVASVADPGIRPRATGEP